MYRCGRASTELTSLYLDMKALLSLPSYFAQWPMLSNQEFPLSL